MKITNSEYERMAKKASPPSPTFKNCALAFLSGGAICTLGQVLYNLYQNAVPEEKAARAFVSITLIFLAALLTAIGVFDNIAKYTGAGTLVPITGFANAVISPAIEFKSEGFINGVGTKMFVIAGPVIVYGISASMLYGIIFYIIQVVKGG